MAGRTGDGNNRLFSEVFARKVFKRFSFIRVHRTRFYMQHQIEHHVLPVAKFFSNRRAKEDFFLVHPLVDFHQLHEMKEVIKFFFRGEVCGDDDLMATFDQGVHLVGGNSIGNTNFPDVVLFAIGRRSVDLGQTNEQLHFSTCSHTPKLSDGSCEILGDKATTDDRTAGLPDNYHGMSCKSIILAMNFLAHLYLSGNRPGVMVGNFIGDFVKGRHVRERFPPDLAMGIDLHRAIDAFTDGHPIVTRSKQRLRPLFRHYSPVVADMFYDHFLAANWSDYHPLPLADFAANVYDLLNSYLEVLPPAVQRLLPYMVKGNWLVSYAEPEGIHKALSGMAARTPYESGMEKAGNVLQAHYGDFREEFMEFFPEIEAYAADYLKM